MELLTKQVRQSEFVPIKVKHLSTGKIMMASFCCCFFPNRAGAVPIL